MQAIWLADVYVSLNKAVTQAIVPIVYAVALKVAIKINDRCVWLSFNNICTDLFQDKYPRELFLQLEKHILKINRFRLDPPTPLDFVLHFMIMERDFWLDNELVIQPFQVAH